MQASNRTILLVEDDEDDARLTLRAFHRSHIVNPVKLVGDGAEALDFLFAREAYAGRAGAPQPTLVVLDLHLPKLDGLNVLKAMRADERTRMVPVMVLTSSQHEDDRVASYALGANSFVRKPVDVVQLVEAVKTVGLYWQIVSGP